MRQGTAGRLRQAADAVRQAAVDAGAQAREAAQPLIHSSADSVDPAEIERKVVAQALLLQRLGDRAG